MSDDVPSVIPTDPNWQPEPAAGARAAALMETLVPGAPGAVEVDIDVTWHDMLAFVDGRVPWSGVTVACQRLGGGR